MSELKRYSIDEIYAKIMKGMELVKMNKHIIAELNQEIERSRKQIKIGEEMISYWSKLYYGKDWTIIE